MDRRCFASAGKETDKPLLVLADHHGKLDTVSGGVPHQGGPDNLEVTRGQKWGQVLLQWNVAAEHSLREQGPEMHEARDIGGLVGRSRPDTHG